jgi:hypothetical protein
MLSLMGLPVHSPQQWQSQACGFQEHLIGVVSACLYPLEWRQLGLLAAQLGRLAAHITYLHLSTSWLPQVVSPLLPHSNYSSSILALPADGQGPRVRGQCAMPTVYASCSSAHITPARLLQFIERFHALISEMQRQAAKVHCNSEKIWKTVYGDCVWRFRHTQASNWQRYRHLNLFKPFRTFAGVMDPRELMLAFPTRPDTG